HPLISYIGSRLPEEAFSRLDSHYAFRPALSEDGRRKCTGPATQLQPIQLLRGIEPGQEARRYPAAPAAHVEVVAVARTPGVVSGCIRHGSLLQRGNHFTV